MSPRDEHDPAMGLQAWLMGPTKAARVEPSADMREAARALMEAFTAYREAGFTESQALKLIMEMMFGGRR